MDRPRLRYVEVIPLEHEGKPAFALRDPAGFAPHTVVVSPAVVLILQHFDGRRSVAEIAAAVSAAVSQEIPVQQIAELAASLDEARFLEGPAFDAHRHDVVTRFRAAPRREPSHAGQAYPAETEELRDWCTALPAAAAPAAAGRLVGAAAPHIDLRFGGASCKQVHETLRQRAPDVDTVVVLGTGHCAADPFVLTRQHYGTPLGDVLTDRELVDELARRLGDDVFDAEFLHAQEHSIEFQAVFLRLGNAAPPRALPVLVGSFHEFLVTGQEPFEDERIRRFVGELQDAVERLGRRVQYLASIDLSHLGPRYGDPCGLTAEEAAVVEQEDRALLALAAAGDAEGFFRHNQERADRRRVCGFSALYTLLRLLPGARGTLLRYEQTTFPGTEDTVAHCAMLFEEGR